MLGIVEKSLQTRPSVARVILRNFTHDTSPDYPRRSTHTKVIKHRSRSPHLHLSYLYLHTTQMSVQFTEPDLEPTYQSIISGGGDYDWAMFNQSGNELKVQATGTGLEDLEEEFMDGR
jgi:hypothetical protein